MSTIERDADKTAANPILYPPWGSLRSKPPLVKAMHLAFRAAHIPGPCDQKAYLISDQTRMAIRKGADAVEAAIAALRLALPIIQAELEWHGATERPDDAAAETAIREALDKLTLPD